MLYVLRSLIVLNVFLHPRIATEHKAFISFVLLLCVIHPHTIPFLLAVAIRNPLCHTALPPIGKVGARGVGGIHVVNESMPTEGVFLLSRY